MHVTLASHVRVHITENTQQIKSITKQSCKFLPLLLNWLFEQSLALISSSEWRCKRRCKWSCERHCKWLRSRCWSQRLRWYIGHCRAPRRRAQRRLPNLTIITIDRIEAFEATGRVQQEFRAGWNLRQNDKQSKTTTNKKIKKKEISKSVKQSNETNDSLPHKHTVCDSHDHEPHVPVQSPLRPAAAAIYSIQFSTFAYLQHGWYTIFIFHREIRKTVLQISYSDDTRYLFILYNSTNEHETPALAVGKAFTHNNIADRIVGICAQKKNLYLKRMLVVLVIGRNSTSCWYARCTRCTRGWPRQSPC